MFTATEIINSGLDEGSSEAIFLARQPILDGDKRLVAYELLFRSAKASAYDGLDGMRATADVMRSAFNMGIERVLGPYDGFINCDTEFLLSDLVEALPAKVIVLEILETVKPDALILERIRYLRGLGYRIALDDYVEHSAKFEPMIDQADIVKVDIAQVPSSQLATLVDKLRRPGLRLLAEKVETPDEFARTHALGFDLYQGYHFAHPERIETRKPRTPEQARMLRLVKLLHADAESDKILDELKRSPSLSLGLLRAANSSALAGHQRVSSLSGALYAIGRQQLFRLIQTMLFSSERFTSASQNPLLQMAVARGKLIEDLVAADVDATFEEQDAAFLVGMLSLIHLVIGVPILQVVDELALPDPLRGALLERSGRLGILLRLIDRIEHCDDAAVQQLLGQLPTLAGQDLVHLQLGAYAWARDAGICDERA